MESNQAVAAMKVTLTIDDQVWCVVCSLSSGMDLLGFIYLKTEMCRCLIVIRISELLFIQASVLGRTIQQAHLCERLYSPSTSCRRQTSVVNCSRDTIRWKLVESQSEVIRVKSNQDHEWKRTSVHRGMEIYVCYDKWTRYVSLTDVMSRARNVFVRRRRQTIRLLGDSVSFCQHASNSWFRYFFQMFYLSVLLNCAVVHLIESTMVM